MGVTRASSEAYARNNRYHHRKGGKGGKYFFHKKMDFVAYAS